MLRSDTKFGLLDKRQRNEIIECARLMAGSEPWITLKRTSYDIRRIIKDPTSEVHVARAHDETIGFAIIRMNGAFMGYIQSIVMKPEYRGQGIGSSFIGYLERRILTEHPNVFICVSSFNPDARRLYERLGYEAIGELRDYIVRGHAEILMRKTVAPLSEFHRGSK